MNIPHKTGILFSLALAFSLPINVSADEIVAPVAAAEQPAAEPMRSMQDLMREMRHDRDPSKCKTKNDAAADADAPGPMSGMGMMGMGMGPGNGGMQGNNCKMRGAKQGQDKPCCMKGAQKKCNSRDDADDQRLDMLEKRMDMMQMMMQMMMRSGGRY